MELDLEAILQTFLTECDEHFAKMEEALVALEANPENDQLLEAIFRGAHTLKGNSASLGYPKVAGFAHVFEELLQRFRNHALPITQERITSSYSAPSTQCARWCQKRSPAPMSCKRTISSC